MKPGYKTTEFWITLAVNLATLISSIAGALPTKWALIAAVTSATLYTLCRTAAKITHANVSVPDAAPGNVPALVQKIAAAAETAGPIISVLAQSLSTPKPTPAPTAAPAQPQS